MISLVKNELIKVIYQRKLAFFLGLIAAMILAPVLFTYISRFKIHDGQTYPLFFLGAVASLILPIFISIITADMFTEEYVSGNLSSILIHPVSRVKLLSAKVVTLYIIILIILMFTLLFSYATGSLFFGWGDSFIDRGITYTSSEGIAITLGSYLMASIPLLAFTLVVMLLALLLHSTSAVVGISISIIIFFSLTGLVITEIQPYLITTYFHYLGEVVMVARNWDAAWEALRIIAIYSIIPYGLGVLIFKKRNLLY